jgi:hypothetical protein
MNNSAYVCNIHAGFLYRCFWSTDVY